MMKKIIKWLYEKYFPKEEIIYPKVTNIIGYEKFYWEIKKIAKQHYLSDSVYSGTTLDEAKRFTEQYGVSGKKWIINKHDCDNFAFALMGKWSEERSYPFGIARGGKDGSMKHMFNIFVNDKGQIYIVEPQNNKFYTIDQAKTKNLYWPIDVILI